MNKILIPTIILFCLPISCEKNNQQDFDYDCSIKTSHFNAENEILSWSKEYYKNDNEIKFEDSDGKIIESQYDKSNNLISLSYDDNKIRYEYNSDNKIIKSEHYYQNSLDYFSVTVYSDTLIQESFSIDNNNDTINWAIYNYSSDNLIESVITNNLETYYYYSDDIDSVISFDKRGTSKYKRYLKNGQKVYEEIRSFDYAGDELSYTIKNWVYNDNHSLIRQTEESYYIIQDNSIWLDSRFQYNSNNQKSRVESFDKANNRLGYSNFYYDDMVLVKIESFDNYDSLKSYIVIENNCNQ